MTNIEFIQAGKRITGFTKKRGYQPVLAFILGVSLQSVKFYATGRRKIPLIVEKLMRELEK